MRLGKGLILNMNTQQKTKQKTTNLVVQKQKAKCSQFHVGTRGVHPLSIASPKYTVDVAMRDEKELVQKCSQLGRER